MVDDLSNRGRRDAATINLNQEFEVRYWTEKLGVSPDELKAAVDRVGNSAAAVEKELA